MGVHLPGQQPPPRPLQPAPALPPQLPPQQNVQDAPQLPARPAREAHLQFGCNKDTVSFSGNLLSRVWPQGQGPQLGAPVQQAPVNGLNQQNDPQPMPAALPQAPQVLLADQQAQQPAPMLHAPQAVPANHEAQQPAPNLQPPQFSGRMNIFKKLLGKSPSLAK